MGLFNKADKASTEALSKRGESHLAPRTFNMTIGGLEKALLKEFPAEDAEKWDRTGLLVGERSLPVTRVAVALDATPAAVAAAAEAGANVLLTHHPAFLEAPDGFAPEASALESPGAVVWAAIRNQVALIDFHTALDVSPAAARVLPGMLGLKFTLRFAEPLEGSRRKGYGQICEVPDNDGEPETLARLAARCMAVFGRAPRVWGAPDAAVRRVVTATGSAASLAPALVAAGVDAVICGEMKYHTALELAAAHVAVIELGHDVSELPLVAVLAEALARAGVPAEAVTLVDQSENWWTPRPSASSCVIFSIAPAQDLGFRLLLSGRKQRSKVRFHGGYARRYRRSVRTAAHRSRDQAPEQGTGRAAPARHHRGRPR